MNKITKEFLESEIISVEYNRLQGTLTHCTITVKSGFVFTGESACVDPNNFDQELGEKFAYEQALDQMWMPYGFWLHKVLAEAGQAGKNNIEDILPKTKYMDFGQAVRVVKNGVRVCRAGWNGKGMFLFLVNGETVTEAINDCYGDPNRYDISHTGYEKGEPSMPVVDAIYMKTADNKLVPWLASQTDVLAEDWQIAD